MNIQADSCSPLTTTTATTTTTTTTNTHGSGFLDRAAATPCTNAERHNGEKGDFTAGGSVHTNTAGATRQAAVHNVAIYPFTHSHMHTSSHCT